MDNLTLIKDMLHNLKYDTLYADMQEYAPAIQGVLNDLKSANDLVEILSLTSKIAKDDLEKEKKRNIDLENELRETKKSYLQTITKMKMYKKRLGEIRILANGGEVKG